MYIHIIEQEFIVMVDNYTAHGLGSTAGNFKNTNLNLASIT